MGVRALYMYGQLLDPVTDGRDYHVSCCGYTIGASATAIWRQTRFIDGREELTIAGVRMELFQTGGESASHMAIWLPDHRVMLTGDEIQGPNYPNLHSLRGTKPRDAIKWVAAIDRMRAYDGAPGTESRSARVGSRAPSPMSSPSTAMPSSTPTTSPCA
jgi:alkyl sulfatase BDS1-like metallo-beta-lactamase superfamily hydrolase